MNIDFSKKITSLSLLLLCVAYAFLGWYLSAYHIIWLVGSFIATVAFFGGRKNSSLFERSLSFFPPGLLGIFIISLIVSLILFALAVNSPILGILIVTPLATTVLAELEMRLTGLNRLNALVILILIAGFGLVVGEMIDVLLVPSTRY
ncbi:hypothetical protein IQ278_10360 [Tolypothrix sp. LEGE 11397]|nr:MULTISPECIES: hypothetical protein [unclassified Tolypothrix]MBE9082524.1 hypothetical protein [Tolypothrix sp. LEGE 11397]BAY93747.1 hypothetical protein NIES3275_57890 [Microchaete diplosiphon NIES-3275]EKF03244.1 hypothetical protein FDUTEX481_02701 [Tolypothrix sp. PCC 7601]UYD27554.1 hypothetical protein HGR01_05600 [Tolypothrix sp. PCC 7712]UYD36584.1 hypothetical protein HG267_13110 [Tolypothrix sp. PCC 7601]